MTKEQFADLLADSFPEKADMLASHYKDYHELLGHVFFPDEINDFLRKLLIESKNESEILKYCGFIEKMWFDGDEDVKNIVTVSIMEGLCDDVVWDNIGNYLSKEFIWAVNSEILPYTAVDAPRLSYMKNNKRRNL